MTGDSAESAVEMYHYIRHLADRHGIKISLTVLGTALVVIGTMDQYLAVMSAGFLMIAAGVGQLVVYAGHDKKECDYCRKIHDDGN